MFDLDAGQPFLQPRCLFICGPRIGNKSLEEAVIGGDGRCGGECGVDVLSTCDMGGTIAVAEVKCMQHSSGL